MEYDVAQAVLGNVTWDDPRLVDEASNWTLLAQIDSHDEICWGDVGTLYWLIRPADLAARQFDLALFTWQCS